MSQKFCQRQALLFYVDSEPRGTSPSVPNVESLVFTWKCAICPDRDLNPEPSDSHTCVPTMRPPRLVSTERDLHSRGPRHRHRPSKSVRSEVATHCVKDTNRKVQCFPTGHATAKCHILNDCNVWKQWLFIILDYVAICFIWYYARDKYNQTCYRPIWATESECRTACEWNKKNIINSIMSIPKLY